MGFNSTGNLQKIDMNQVQSGLQKERGNNETDEPTNVPCTNNEKRQKVYKKSDLRRRSIEDKTCTEISLCKRYMNEDMKSSMIGT